jgi:WD40 repeat protein
LRLWDIPNGRLINTFTGHTAEINAVAFSPDGRRVASASEDTTVRIWDTATGRLLVTFEKHEHRVSAVTFSPDGRRILSAGGSWQEDKGTAIELWDSQTGKPIRTLTGHTKEVRSIAFSPDGRQALSGSFDGLAIVWDLATGRIAHEFDHGDTGVTAVAFAPDGRRVLTGAEDGDVKLWNVANGQLLRTFEHGRPVTSIAASPDFTRVISGSGDTLDLASEGTAGAGDNKVKLWEIATGKLLRTFEGHAGGVKSVAFARDGTRFLSGSQDAKVNLWQAQSGRLLASFAAAGKADWLAITPEGFFNSTRGGSKLLAIAKDADVITVDQTHQSLFNPDLVRESIAGDSKGEVSEAAKIVNLEKILGSGPAPTVAITSHPLTSESTGDLVTVQARVVDMGKGIGRIEWRVNNITAAVLSKPSGSGPERTLSQSLALDPGDNAIEVVAYNEANLLASVPARTTIKFTGSADRAKPKLHVLAIGINAYADRGTAAGPDLLRFPKLALAVNDANAFGAEMKRAAGSLYEDATVTYALDGDATKEKLVALIDKLAAEVRPRDTFVLFAAAHGTSVNGRFYLIPQDFRGSANDLARGAIGQDELQDWLANRIKAKRAIVLLDTCESGALVAGFSRARTDVPASEAAVGRLHEATGRPVLTAAAQGKPALEGYQKHGVFTWALLDALRKGDSNGNGLIELSELVAHVQTAVPAISRQLDGTGRGMIAVDGTTETGPEGYQQTARFGSRGEDFPLVGKLQ